MTQPQIHCRISAAAAEYLQRGGKMNPAAVEALETWPGLIDASLREAQGVFRSQIAGEQVLRHEEIGALWDSSNETEHAGMLGHQVVTALAFSVSRGTVQPRLSEKLTTYLQALTHAQLVALDVHAQRSTREQFVESLAWSAQTLIHAP